MMYDILGDEFYGTGDHAGINGAEGGRVVTHFQLRWGKRGVYSSKG
jgi:hypothetical protein